ncbi:MAG: CBS domain-containing protein [Thermomicrobiales bacterium]
MTEPTVADLMRREVPIASPGDSVASVARMLAESGLPGVPVVEDGDIVGIVTESDIIAREADVDVPPVVPFLDAIFVADGGRDFDEELRKVVALTAGELMTSPVYNIMANATLEQVATLMINERVNPVPVVDENLQLVGIVTRADLVKLIARLEADEKS